MCFAGYKNTTFLLVFFLIGNLFLILKVSRYLGLCSGVPGGAGLGVQPPPPEILKTLQHRAKLNPIAKTIKNC